MSARLTKASCDLPPCTHADEIIVYTLVDLRSHCGERRPTGAASRAATIAQVFPRIPTPRQDPAA